MASWTSTYCDTTSTPSSGRSSRRVRAARIASLVYDGGKRMSRITASGSSRGISASSSSADSQVAATTQPVSISSRAIPSRSSTLCSAIMTRTGAMP